MVPAGERRDQRDTWHGFSNALSHAFELAATTVIFTYAVQPGATIHAADITELRAAANALRAAAGLAPFAFTDSSLTGAPIRAIHTTELRAAIDAARSALVLPPIAYTDPTLAAGMLPKAAHITELRAGVQ